MRSRVYYLPSNGMMMMTMAGRGLFFQIWVYGNSFESFLVAVVNPNQAALEHWAKENGVSGDFASLCGNPRAKEFILGELTKTGKANKVSMAAHLLLLWFSGVGHG